MVRYVIISTILQIIGGVNLLKYPISIFLDTNIFIEAKYDFSSNGIFSTLIKYIKNGKIILYISDIVVNEVKKHINEDVVSLSNIYKDARKNALKKFSSNILENTSIASLFTIIDKKDLKKEMIMLFENFLRESNVHKIDNSDVDCNQIIADYFLGNPPFELKDSKKYEFPDAIMAAKLKSLFSLENPIYIISNDSGFRGSFKAEQGFNTFESLKEVFNLINKESKIYNELTSFIRLEHTQKLLDEKITDNLYNTDININGIDYDRKGLIEGYEYDSVDITDVSQVGYELHSVDNIMETTVNITISCIAVIQAVCTYLDLSNSVWDSEEGDYIYATWGKVEETHHPTFDCEVAFEIKQEGEKINFEFKSISSNIWLEQRTRLSRHEIPYVDPKEELEAERMEALEEYYKHH